MQDNEWAEPEPVRQLNPAVEFFSRLFTATPRVYVTYVLVALNVAIFIAMWASMLMHHVSLTSPDGIEETIYRWGANYAPAVTNGEWWRLLASMFIHGGLAHIFFNMFALWDTGRIVERIFGNIGFFLIYLISGLFASLTSIRWHPDVISVGASGAIFGIFGAFIAYLIRQPHSIPPAILKRLQTVAGVFLVINLLFSAAVPGIDMAAHIGGLLTGFACGLVMSLPLSIEGVSRRWQPNLKIAVVGSLLLAVCAYVTPKVKEARREAIDYMKNKDYTRSIGVLNEVIQRNPDDTEAYFRRGLNYFNSGDYTSAVRDFTIMLSQSKESPERDGAISTVYLQRGWAQFYLGDDEKAELDWKVGANLEGVPPELQAGLLENIGMIYLRGQRWQEALDHSSDVNKIYDRSAWNWLVRAIAQDKLNAKQSASTSYKEWQNLKKDTDIEELNKILPEPLHIYLTDLPR